MKKTCNMRQVIMLYVLIPLCAWLYPNILFARQVAVIEINDPITPVISEYIINEINTAEIENSECIIIQMDTPGGLDLAMRDIIKAVFSSQIPVIVYVAPAGARAASAGAIITMAAHIAAMSPGTNIGAAHPVNLGGGNMSDEMSAKVENDAAAYVESIAVKRNRNSDWAVKAVRESVSISEDEALRENVIDIIAPDITKLLQEINGREIETTAGTKKLNTIDAQVVVKKMGVRENILKALANPNIAYILFLVGLAGLYFELSNPGAIFPGVIGGLSLILAFYSLQSLSANYAGVLLILLGVVLFIIELKVVSYGLLSIGGIVAITLGSLMLFQSSVPYLSLSLKVILPSVTLISLFFTAVIFLVVKSQKTRPATGKEGLISMTGEAVTDIANKGKVFIHGEYWNARSSDPIPKGSIIKVVKIDGMVLDVEKKI